MPSPRLECVPVMAVIYSSDHSLKMWPFNWHELYGISWLSYMMTSWPWPTHLLTSKMRYRLYLAAEILAQKLLLTFWKLFSYFSLHATDGIDGQTDIRTECNAYRGVLTGGLTNNEHSLTWNWKTHLRTANNCAVSDLLTSFLWPSLLSSDARCPCKTLLREL